MCFRLKSCCGCNSVEKGSTIIAILGMVFSGLGMLSAAVKLDVGGIFSNCLNFAFSYMLFHGVKHRNTCMVLAYMILQMMSVVITGICILALFIFAIMLTSVPEQDYDNIATQLQENLPYFHDMSRDEVMSFVSILPVVLWVTTIIITVVFAVTVYLWSVVYSFYKEMQEELRGGMVLSAEEGRPAAAAESKGFEYGNLPVGAKDDLPPPYTMKS